MTNTPTTSLGEEYQNQLARLNRAIGIYDSLPGGVGFFGSALIKDLVSRATKAMNDGDIVQMITLYDEMLHTAEDC